MTAGSGRDAVDNARAVDRYDEGMCLKYVRSIAWEIGSLYGSAIDAWYGAVDRHPGDRTPPLGAPLFYRGGQYGHVVVNTQGNAANMRSTDMPSGGVVSEDVIAWCENHWGYEYLGWTGDLNGVDLPLGDGDEDEMKQEDFERIRSIVADEVAKNNDNAAERFWRDEMDVEKPATGEVVTKPSRQVLREVWQRIVKMG